MIKFFRKIRFDLMEKNKTGKYLKYAIGEIILVVIGILIALQINNWNEIRKAKLNENSIYKNMLVDVKTEESLLKGFLSDYKIHSDAYHQIYSESIGEAPSDSTSLFYNYLMWNTIYDYKVSQKYTPVLSEIKNDKIINIINSKLYLETVDKQAKSQFNVFKNEKLLSFCIDHGIYNSNTVFNQEKYKFEPLYNNNIVHFKRLTSQYGSLEFDQLLLNLKIRSSWAIENLEKLIENNNKLKKALEKILDKN